MTSIRFGTAYVADYGGIGEAAQRFQRAKRGEGYQPIGREDKQPETRAEREADNAHCDRLLNDKDYVRNQLPPQTLKAQGPGMVWIHASMQRNLSMRSGREDRYGMADPYDIVVINKDSSSSEIREAVGIKDELSRLNGLTYQIGHGRFDNELEANGVPLLQSLADGGVTRIQREKLYKKWVQPQIDALKQRIDEITGRAKPVPVEFRQYCLRPHPRADEVIVGDREEAVQQLQELGYSEAKTSEILDSYDQKRYPIIA